MDAGADALPDYELLELLLFLAIPRRDVKPVAKRLIDTFGSFAEVISAEPARLSEVEGIGEAAVVTLKTVQASAQRLTRGPVGDRATIGSWDTLVDYCRTVMAFKTTEQFRVLYLDRKNGLIADEVQGHGTVDHTPVYAREVVKRGARGRGLGGDPGPQSPERRSHAVEGRHRDHPTRGRRGRQARHRGA